MKIIHHGRRMGKTTKVIKLANDTGAYIVVPTRQDVMRLMEYNPPPDRFPLTWNEFLDCRMQGSFVRNIVFDDIDRCLAMLAPVVIEGLSITGEITP